MRITSVIVSLSLGCSCPVLAAPRQAASDVVEFSSPEPGRVVVPAFVGGRGPYRFLLDTGSTHSAVTEALAGALDLAVVAQAPITTSTQTRMYKVIRLDSLAIGSVRSSVLLATVLPRATHDVLGPGVDGIVGQDFLSRFNFTLDYRHSRLRWHDQSAKGVTLALKASQGRFVIALPQSSDTGSSLQLVPDSGSAGLVLFRTERVASLPLTRDPRPWTVSTLAGGGTGQPVTLKTLSVGLYNLRDISALILPARIAEDCDGLLPLQLFSRVSFNNTDGRLVIEPE